MTVKSEPSQMADVCNTVLCGDVLSMLDELPASPPFDVVVADPPYNIGKDFGTNHDSLTIDDYVAWSVEWIGKCRSLLVSGGVLYVYGFAEILARIAARYPVEEQRWLAWHYTNKAVPSATYWQRSHESILSLWREGEKRPKLEIDQIREPYTAGYMACVGRERAGTDSRFNGGNGRATTYLAHENGALPRDVIHVPALAGGAGAKERWFMCHDCGDRVFPPSCMSEHRGHNVLKHPTQKPQALTQRLIRSRVTPLGGRVLVPFAGSGAECVAARECGADFVGIEINPLYVDFANKWLNQSRV